MDVSSPFLLFAVVACAAPAGALFAGFVDALGSIAGEAFTLAESLYRRVPTLVLALSTLAVLAAVALVSALAYARRRRKVRQAAGRRIGTPRLPGLQEAWLTIEGGAGGTMPLAGQFVRIGRHEDNDVRLTDKSVHRHHAVIERMPDEAFVIRDMSGEDGNGMRVNGRRLPQARLADGDMIELGRAKLRFENAPV